jgi:hypothetical protein
MRTFNRAAARCGPRASKSGLLAESDTPSGARRRRVVEPIADGHVPEFRTLALAHFGDARVPRAGTIAAVDFEAVDLSNNLAIVAVEEITSRIFTIRGLRVLLDVDIAALYEVPTKQFNQAVGRNPAKFPSDFMFQLTENEWDSLRSQFVTLKTGRGAHRKYLPYVLTEHGALMASAVLNSERAAEVAVYVMRAFVQLRKILVDNQELARRLDDLERKHTVHDKAIIEILATIRELMRPAPTDKRPIGFA